MNLTNILCFFVQPWVNGLQAMLDIMYIPLSFLGIAAPPVASWFQPFLPCIT